jgi:hypothetical protein
MNRGRISLLFAFVAATVFSGSSFAHARSTAEPDLSGVWEIITYQPEVKTLSGDLPPFLPWAASRYRASVQAQDAGKPLIDSSTLCLPHGIPRLMYAPYPFQIIQKRKRITILHEVNHLVRFIYMDESHPTSLGKPTYLGHSVGRWDGSDLIIDSIGFNDLTLIDRAGIPHTEALHVIERYSLRDGGKGLEGLITIDDPKTFSHPWQTKIVFKRSPDVHITEYACAENNKNSVQIK